jgi:hypothetical protein
MRTLRRTPDRETRHARDHAEDLGTGTPPIAALIRRRVGATVRVAALVALGIVTLSCGSEGRGFDSGSGAGGPDGGGPALDDDGGSLGSGTGDPAGCTGDLQGVVDDRGQVIRQCPPDEGCAAGRCVPACEAAAASKGSLGCDFLAATPASTRYIEQGCFAIVLANAWGRPVRVKVTRGGTSFDASGFGRIAEAGVPEAQWARLGQGGIPVGKVGVLFLSAHQEGVKCPITPAVDGATAFKDSGRGAAWHVEVDAPVSAYDIFPYGGAAAVLPSAQLVFPTTAWGNNYITVVPPLGSYDLGFGKGPQWGQVIAKEDDTTVRVFAAGDIRGGGGVAGVSRGSTGTFRLGAGEYVQWSPQQGRLADAPMEFSGSILESDKPIAFVGGNGNFQHRSATNVRSGSAGGGDSAHQQIPPLSALGSEYAVAAYTTRRKNLADESIPYRIMAAVDGTALTYDPPVPGAPLSLARGQVLDFEARGSFVVKAQDNGHPFFVAQMMTGYQLEGGARTDGQGDEEFVNVLPPAQFLGKYVFFTDSTYDTTNLVVTRVRGESGFQDVEIDCLGTIGGWKPLGSDGRYERTDVDLVRDGTPVGTCVNGPHWARSAGRFGLTVWGLAGAASYAYPAGGNAGAINQVRIPAAPPR